MQRILTATIFLLTLGLAFGQPPVDYTVLCEVEVEGEVETTVVGAASYVDSELRVALDEGWTCEGTLTVEQDAELTVTIDIDDETGETTVTLATDGEEDADLTGVARTVPEEAIAGMVGAQKNRAAAATHRADAEAKADAARERAGAARDDSEKDDSEKDDATEESAEEHRPEERRPEDLPEPPDDAPEGPEAAVERATEMSGGAGPGAKPEEPGEGRP